MKKQILASLCIVAMNGIVIAADTPEKLAFEPEMVAIKGGCFKMGSPEAELTLGSGEEQHEVCVKDFEIAKYEVTQAQWQAVMGNNPAKFKGENLPVEKVSWHDVQIFIGKLNAKTGKTYRLPTEAEWEYAARAGTTTPFYTGLCINTEQANYDGRTDYNKCGAETGVYKKQTVAVGSYEPNNWGLYDMAGNVREWTCSDPDGKTQCSANNATSSLFRAVRGGSWDRNPEKLRSASSDFSAPDNRLNDLGFRLAKM